MCKISRKVHEQMNGSRLAFRFSIDGTKVAKVAQISQRYGAIVGGSYPDYFINTRDMLDKDVINTLEKFNDINDHEFSHADEVKIDVVCLQVTPPKTNPYIFLAGRSKTLNQKNDFIDIVVEGCTSVCSKLKNPVLLSVAMNGVSYESVWCIEQMCKYLDGKTNVVGLKDNNHNMKNPRYQIMGGSSVAVLGKEVVDPFLLKITAVSTELWITEDYASYLIFLRLDSTRILTKICMLEKDNDNTGSLTVLCLSLYFMRLRLYAINTTDTNYLERMKYMWASFLWFTSFDH